MSDNAESENVAAEPVAASRRYLDLPVPRPDFEYPLSVTYCGECGLPLEYCEYGATQQKARCRTWLEKALPDEFARLNSEPQSVSAPVATSASAAEASGESASAQANSTRQKRGGKGVARKEKDAQPAGTEGEDSAAPPSASAAAVGKKPQNAAAAVKARVRIWTVPRGKGKFVTAVGGVNAIEKDLKVLAKALGTKMACGASVSNAEAGEIVVQGDVAEKLKKFLLDKYSTVLSDDQIEISERAD